ncbi:DUF2894 domain-containing protein [Marinobacter nauticus]
MPETASTTSELPLLRHLQETGAAQADPVRFRYLEALEQRLGARGLQGSVHWQKLEQAVSEYHARYDQARSQPQPEAPGKPELLATLIEQLNQAQPPAPAGGRASTLEQLIFGTTEEKPEPTRGATALQPLKSMARARADHGAETRQKRIRQAIEQTPEGAGPMNSHRLVSRAIAEMQRLSPEYLNRFVSYADTLMALEQLGRKN